MRAPSQLAAALSTARALPHKLELVFVVGCFIGAWLQDNSQETFNWIVLSIVFVLAWALLCQRDEIRALRLQLDLLRHDCSGYREALRHQRAVSSTHDERIAAHRDLLDLASRAMANHNERLSALEQWRDMLRPRPTPYKRQP